jgi:hypothetical protein
LESRRIWLLVIEPMLVVFRHELLKQLVFGFRRDIIRSTRWCLGPFSAENRLLGFFARINTVLSAIHDRILSNSLDQLTSAVRPWF